MAKHKPASARRKRKIAAKRKAYRARRRAREKSPAPRDDPAGVEPVVEA